MCKVRHLGTKLGNKFWQKQFMSRWDQNRLCFLFCCQPNQWTRTVLLFVAWNIYELRGNARWFSPLRLYRRRQPTSSRSSSKQARLAGLKWSQLASLKLGHRYLADRHQLGQTTPLVRCLPPAYQAYNSRDLWLQLEFATFFAQFHSWVLLGQQSFADDVIKGIQGQKKLSQSAQYRHEIRRTRNDQFMFICWDLCTW